MSDELAELKGELGAIQQEIRDATEGSSELEELRELEAQILETISELEHAQPPEDDNTESQKDVEDSMQAKIAIEPVDTGAESPKGQDETLEPKKRDKPVTKASERTEERGTPLEPFKTIETSRIGNLTDSLVESKTVKPPVPEPNKPADTSRSVPPKNNSRQRKNDDIDRLLDNSKANWKSFASSQKPKKSIHGPLGTTLGGSIQKAPKRRHF